MADNFDDKNLFGDSFDFLQSSDSLFGENNFGGQNANLKTNAQTVNKTITSTTANMQNQKVVNNAPKADFGFDDNLFGGDLFGSNDISKTTSAPKTTQTQTNIDFGFDDNNLFGQTDLPKETKQDVPNNLFDMGEDLFGNAETEDTQEQEISEETEQTELFSDNEDLAVEDDNVEEENIEEVSEENLDEEETEPEDIEEEIDQNIEDALDSDQSLDNQEKVQEKPKPEKIKKEKVEKPKKVKPEKTPEQKERDKKRNKLIVLISSAVLALILSVVCIVVFANQPGPKLLTPGFELYQRSSGTVLVVEEQDGVQGYEVVISQTGKPDTIFTSKDNTIELRLYFNEPGIFDVKVRVLGLHEVEHSDYSESKQITNFVKLDTPILFKEDNQISWNKVAGAVGYKLCYKANVMDNTVEFIELPETQNTFDLTQLNQFGAGLYPIYVMAIASGEYMVNSDYSDVVNYAYVSAMDEPLSVLYDAKTRILTFVTLAHKTQSQQYLVVASMEGGSVLANHYVFANELETQITTYQGMQAIKYTVRLNEILDGEPMNLTIKALGDGIYSTDSDVVDAVEI